MKNTIVAFLMAVIMIFSFTVSAQQQITIIVDGKVIESDVAPQVVNCRTMLPLRAIFEPLGAQVDWAGEDQLAFATKGNCFITLQLGNNKMSVQQL